MRITITGPRSVGKSTISKLLCKKLGLKYISGDILMDNCLKPYGGLSKVLREKNKELIYKFLIPRTKKALFEEKVIFDLAGGSLTEKNYSAEMIEIIKKKSLIIGILPSEKDDEAINILFPRERKRKHFDYLSDEELRKKVIKNYKSVKQAILKNVNNIIYCENLSPEELVEKIVNIREIKDNFYK